MPCPAREHQVHNLPAPLSSFIGREREVAEVRGLLASRRLLTLTGPGGCGKTRLAIAAVEQLMPGFDGPIWFVDLSALGDPALVPRAVATALHVREEPGAPLVTTLTTALAPHQSLLVLDNCEHLVGACADLAEALLRGCTGLRVLATSREMLGIAGEQAWSIPSLSFPAAPLVPGLAVSESDLLRFEAVRLFVARARAASPTFQTDLPSLAVIGAICRRLDGLPLAIELTAARMRVLSVQQLAARLDACLSLLSAGSRTAPLRHQTMTAALEWSYRLLSAQERVLLCRLSVFAGGWSLEAAEAVCSGETVAPAAVLDLLSGLVHKSLVIIKPQGSEMRYQLLEVVRQYAHAGLVASGEQPRLRDRHLEFFAELITCAAPHLIGADQVVWFDRLELELDNLRAAMDQALEVAAATSDPEHISRALCLPADLERFWSARGFSGEGAGRLGRALDLAGARAGGAARAYALNAAGVLAWVQANHTEAQRLLDEALTIGELAADPMIMLSALRNLGTLAVLRRDIVSGVALLERGLELGRAIGTAGRHSIAWIMAVLGSAAYLQGDDTRAGALFEESAMLLRALGDVNFLALVLRRLAQIALRQGAVERASAPLCESLKLNRQLGSPSGVAACVVGLAGVLLARGRPNDAARLIGCTQALLDETADQLTAADREMFEVVVERAGTCLGEAFAAARAQGYALRGEAAVAHAISLVERLSAEPPAVAGATRPASRAEADSLTAREREVAMLVARGHSNRAIARALTVEVKTVEAHMTQIRAKLGTSSRVQVAIWAREHALA